MPSSEPKRDEQVGRRLVADPGHARDVVGGVALEADEVGHERRGNAVAGLDALGRVDVDVGHAARREQHADVLADELERVAVVRDHARRDALLVGAQAERADDVVGLVALELDVAVPERLDERAQVGLLLLEQRRRRLARGLVAGEALEPVHGPRVPGHDDALRVVVGEQPHEHVGEAEQRVRREAVGRRELLRERVVGPVGERVAVDQEEPRGARGPVVEIEIHGLGDHREHRVRTGFGPGRRPARPAGAAARWGIVRRGCRARRARRRPWSDPTRRAWANVASAGRTPDGELLVKRRGYGDTAAMGSEAPRRGRARARARALRAR